jgi:hypothetical protein
MGGAALPRTLSLGLALVALLLGPGDPATAQPRVLDLALPELAQIASAADDAEVRERLLFLEERLDTAQAAGRRWYWSWFGIDSAGLIASSVRAALADDGDGRVLGIVNAGKSAVGLGRLVAAPLPARFGADPIRAMPAATPEQRLARLHAAEALLEDSAERAEEKFTPWPHLSNALLNLAGGGIILGLGDWRDAAISTGLGLAIGELRIWTAPGRPARDLEAYQGRFGALASEARASFEVTARPNGLAVTFRF